MSGSSTPRRSWPHPPAGVSLAGLALLTLLFASGCAHRPEPPRAPPAQLALENHSDFVWRVELRPVGGGEAWSTELPPRAHRIHALPAGDYTPVASPLPLAPGTLSAHALPLRLESGRHYTWPLATLLSEEEAAP
jgi:hypothetical protein